MAEKLKREFIELLETDKEFRYTVAGYLGLSEILRRMDALEERMDRLWENQNRLWENQTKLWENQERLWESVRRLEENQSRLWEEVRALREGQEKLWENQKKLWEGQEKLREGQERLWESVKRLEDGQERLWESVRRLEAGQDRLWRYVKSGFGELREMLGVTFEATARAFIEVLLDEMGYPDARVGVKHFAVDGEVVEVDVFCEEPLVVGEITNYIGTREQAESEVEKLRSRVSMVEGRYGRRALLAVLVVGSAPEEIGSYLRELAGRNGIRLVLGREIRERLEA